MNKMLLIAAMALTLGSATAFAQSNTAAQQATQQTSGTTYVQSSPQFNPVFGN